MDVAHFPVGLESRVEEVCSLLNKHPHPDKATMVGIIGLGGIGKTTIARALYNKIASNFKHICFLHNVKEKFIHDLQKRLLSETVREKDMELEDYRCGIPIIMNRLHNKKVLLILDDIDTLEQLKALAGKPNWFGSGSIIIITTRDKNLLEKHEVERIYEVKELNDEEAHDLLIGNAVGKEAADPKYKEVINRAIEYARGLPLVLEILGSSMRTADSIWGLKTSLDMYEKIPNKTVQKILKVSFDGLEEMHKEIFLDIACFYREWRLRDVTIILSVCHNIDSEFCIRVMMDKSLIKINQYGWLDMHDLIQDMGKEIVRQESPRKAGKRSRLWSEEDILEVLNRNTGTGKVQGVVDNVDKRMVEWSGDAFEKMKNLRVLSVSWDTKFSQGPKCLPNSLRVVEWDYYPSSTLPDNFCPSNLVILCLRYGRFKTLEIAFKKFFNLRKLNLEGCKSLEELPDMSGAADLEELNVSYCKKITKIDSSIGHLAKLKVLKAKSCKMLDTFIVGGMKLVSLEILKLSYCPKLCTFPEILVKIEKFKKLDLSETAIKKLPKSIENLIALEALHLRSCEELHQLPNLACFHKLKILDLRFCRMLKKVTGIRPNIEVFSAGWCTSLTSRSTGLLLSKKFFNLRKLNLEGCENLEELSDVSGVAYLEELDVGYCKKLTKIDDSVGYLAKLRVLNVERCEVLDTFIVGGIKLVSLEILNLRGCYKLHTFPEILVTMKKIKTLDLSDTAIKIFPDSIEKLVTLEALYLSSCKELRQLPNFALHNLKTLNLDWCKELEEIRGIPSSIEIFFAQSCISLTSHSTRLLLTQELHENGNTQFILPGKEIPKWFHKQSTEGSVSFWVRKKFPQIALCAILRNGPLISSSIEIHVNGTHKFDVRDVILPQIEIEIGIDHIILFDLRKEGKDFKIGRDLLEKELNHVVVSWHGMGIGFSYQFVECIGVYVYNYDSCMEDIVFENPSPQRGTPEEVVHRICDSDLESLSVCYDDRGDFRDWIQEDDKLNKEIIDLAAETVSNIEKKKGQLNVDNVNLTLSLALSEPSSDTTGHRDDKLNKEIMDSSSKAASGIEKKERKLNMDYENLTLSLALPEPSNDTTGHHDLQQQQQQQHLTSINQQNPESSEIIKKANGKDIIVYEGNTNEKKGRNTSENYRISSNSESFNWDCVTCEDQLKGQKDSTIIDIVYDGRACHNSKDLPQQQHLSSIHQQIPKFSENVKEAKGKDIMVHEGNSNEKRCNNPLEGQLPELVHRQTQKEELHLANDKCLTHLLGQRTAYFQDKDCGNRPPSKRKSDQITVEHLQEQKKKIREEVVVEVREEMRLREERMRVDFEERLASLLASFQQGLISTMFPTNAMGNATTSSTDNSTSNVTPSSPREQP